MSFSARSVANEFIHLAKGQDLSPMKLQKLVYFAHGWHLAITDKPLIRENIEAWQYGPVIPELYQELKAYGSRSVSEPVLVFNQKTGDFFEPRVIRKDDPEAVEQAKDIIKDVWKTYGKHSAIKLSNATHMAGTPWEQTYVSGASNVVIDDDLIRDYFRALLP